jgi:hypothetical protein
LKNKALALGIKVGFFWGVAVFGMTWLSYLTGYGMLFIESFSVSAYPGYSISPAGSFIGLVWGFFYGLVSGFIIVKINNWVNKK